MDKSVWVGVRTRARGHAPVRRQSVRPTDWAEAVGSMAWDRLTYAVALSHSHDPGERVTTKQQRRRRVDGKHLAPQKLRIIFLALPPLPRVSYRATRR